MVGYDRRRRRREGFKKETFAVFSQKLFFSSLGFFFHLRSFHYFPFAMICLLLSEPEALRINESNSLRAYEKKSSSKGYRVKNLTAAKHPKFIADHFCMTEDTIFLSSFGWDFLRPPQLGPPTQTTENIKHQQFKVHKLF